MPTIPARLFEILAIQEFLAIISTTYKGNTGYLCGIFAKKLLMVLGICIFLITPFYTSLRDDRISKSFYFEKSSPTLQTC